MLFHGVFSGFFDIQTHQRMAGQEPVLRAPAYFVNTLWAPQIIILFRVRKSLGCLASEGFSLEMAANSTEAKKITDECSPVRRQSHFLKY